MRKFQTIFSLLLLFCCARAHLQYDAPVRSNAHIARDRRSEPLGPHDDSALFDLNNDGHWAWLLKQSVPLHRQEFVGDLDDMLGTFKEWAIRHEKQYMIRDTPHHFGVFKSNHDHVRHHNSRKEVSYTLSVNQFADLSNAEFRALGYVSPKGYKRARQPNYGSFRTPWGGLPERVDWREKGAVTPVKNQGQCGSCWAFSTTGAIEGAVEVAKGKLTSLSEQELMDCSGDEGNESCNGGMMDFAFEWVIKHGGIGTEQCYPYEMMDEDSCNPKNCSNSAVITSYKDVKEKDEEEMLSALAQQPVAVAIDAGSIDFQLYHSGVYDNRCGTDLDHGVLAVGYGTENGQDYFLVKNSWGPNWGDDGYIKMVRGDKSLNDGAGQCGILLVASVPIV